jgi:hypothetical protein
MGKLCNIDVKIIKSMIHTLKMKHLVRMEIILYVIRDYLIMFIFTNLTMSFEINFKDF